VLSQPAVKLLVRNPELSSDAMVAVLDPVLGHAAAARRTAMIES
jgi:hypothetical protein